MLSDPVSNALMCSKVHRCQSSDARGTLYFKLCINVLYSRQSTGVMHAHSVDLLALIYDLCIHTYWHYYYNNSYLRSQGVDGVKVDAQSVVNFVGFDNGGRYATL
jgi:Raffinose synthase or seed imbibition protein Sip1